MLIVALALIVVAATAAVVIRDASPRPAKPMPGGPEPATDTRAGPLDPPTQAIDMTELLSTAADDPGVPTRSMPMALAGGQAAAVLPYPVAPAAAPNAQPLEHPAAFVPAGVPHLQPDPDRLIQTEVVVEDPGREHSAAVTKLALGIAASGTVIGLVVVGAGRGIGSLIHMLVR